MADKTIILSKDPSQLCQEIPLIEGDNNTYVIRFVAPRYSGGVDLANLTWGVNIKNATLEQGFVNLSSATSDDSAVYIDWNVGSFATALHGSSFCTIEGRNNSSSAHPVWKSSVVTLRVGRAISADDIIDGSDIDSITEIAENVAESIVANSVRYDTSQSLNSTQKTTARTNIGATSQAEVQQAVATETSAREAAVSAETTAREASDNELKSDFEELVVVSETEPQTEATKVWIKSNTSEVQIPTFAEFSDLRDASVFKNGGKQVKPENLSFVTFGSNLYDGHALYVGRINGGTGELRPTSTSYVTTDFIPLNIMSGTYLLAEKLGNLNHNAYGFYDANLGFISGAEATETNAVEIPAGAEYVRVSYTSSTTPDQIMITRSNNTTVVPYEPFSFEIPTSVINNSFRSSLNKTQLGNELNTYLSNWTAAGGSQWDSTKSQYNIPVGGSISKQFTVEANTAYMIVLTMSTDPNPYTPMLTIDSRLVVSLGDASMNIFGANDGTFAVALTPTTGGTVNGVIASAENWTGALKSVSIRKVVEYPVPSLQLNDNGLYLNGYNTGFGTGLRTITNDYNDNGRVFYGTANTSMGYHAQDKMDTGRYNNAYGYGSQQNMTNGSSNNAYGTHTQEDATTAMYNNAFGSSSQRRLTKGCWNVAMGNESQRDITDGCNNVGIGRRAQNDINSGQRNIAIGALAGFICTGRSSVSTVNEEDQILIGCMATQLRRNSNRGIAIGSYSGCGNNGIAIGYGAEADDNDITIGTATNTGTVKIAGKTISFNQDGTVTWS